SAKGTSRYRRLADRRPPPSLVQAINDADPSQPVAIFVDLLRTSVLPATVWLNQRGFVVVPVIQRWVAFPAVLNCSRLIEQLVTFGGRCRRPSWPRGVVFVLDGDRAGRKRMVIPPDRFDNRYAYSGSLFPAPEELRRRGFHVVRWVGTAALAS